MSKYSYEFKKKIVEEYLRGEGRYEYLANKHGVKSEKDVKKRVNYFRIAGPDALKPNKKDGGSH